MYTRALRIDPESGIKAIDIISAFGTEESMMIAIQFALGGKAEEYPLRDGGTMFVLKAGEENKLRHNDLASYISSHHVYGRALIMGREGGEISDAPNSFVELMTIM